MIPLIYQKPNAIETPAPVLVLSRLGVSPEWRYFLPPYSPDFNLTEKMRSKIKSQFRRLEARTKKEFSSAITKAFETVTDGEASGWFSSCHITASQTRIAPANAGSGIMLLFDSALPYRTTKQSDEVQQLQNRTRIRQIFKGVMRAGRP